MKSPIESLKSEGRKIKSDWDQGKSALGQFLMILVFAYVMSVVLPMMFTLAKADQELTFQPKIDFSTHWIIPIQKNGAGVDLNNKVAYLSIKCLQRLTKAQCVRVAGLVDHESAGTWSPTVKGDGGCSTGIAQWNNCPGSNRKAPKTFEEQVELIVNEMADKFSRHTIDLSTCLHNSPAGKCAVDHWKNGRLVLGYVSKVKLSAKLFN